MIKTINCYETCINTKYQLSDKMWQYMEDILLKMRIISKTGRPPLDLRRAMSGVYYLLRTGMQWNALPRCFGSSSAIHRFFKKLVRFGFFKQIWHDELQRYQEGPGLKLEVQAADCAYIKAPLGQEKTGKSPS